MCYLLCRAEPAATGIKRPRPQDAEPGASGELNGVAEAPHRTSSAALAAEEAAIKADLADTAAMDAAKAVTQRADAVLQKVRCLTG